jgi:hypothetical protein
VVTRGIVPSACGPLCLLVALALAACEPELNVGEWACAGGGDAATPLDRNEPIALPWSTGFEEGFCDYVQPTGFCYGDPLASFTSVTSPVRSGRYAAAFSVTAGNPRARQTRCVRQGVLPAVAYYGAWYFVPSQATNSALWNLIHFQGGDAASSEQHGLWDISLINGRSGQLEVVAFDFLHSTLRRSATPTPIPIGAWFHLEFYLKRADDETGEIALYQDDQLLLRETDLVTDDSSWGQWYVGNLAEGLSPPDSTLYVDDITIRSTR